MYIPACRFIWITSCIFPLIHNVFAEFLEEISETYDNPTLIQKRTPQWEENNPPDIDRYVCTEAERKYLLKQIPQVAALAKAGSEAFDVILSMLMEPKPSDPFKDLSGEEKARYKLTFLRFFAEDMKAVDKPSVSALVSKNIEILDRIKDQTEESWPSSVRFACTSAFYQVRDDQDREWNNEDLALPKSQKGKQWWFDYSVYNSDGSRGEWTEDWKECSCPPEAMAFTSNWNQNPKGVDFDANGEKRDRITFCPKFFRSLEDGREKPLERLVPKEGGDINKLVRRTGFRAFLHEHLHTWAFNLVDFDSKDRRIDVDGKYSYGSENVLRIANPKKFEVGPEKQKRVGWKTASSNIESLVFWCVAMYFDKWDWHTGMARVPTAEKPKGT